VNLIDVGSSPPEVLAVGAVVYRARWKVSGPFATAKYPASGFVTVLLAENQQEAIKGKDIVAHLPKRRTVDASKSTGKTNRRSEGREALGTSE
jgi:hypothetical protein